METISAKTLVKLNKVTTREELRRAYKAWVMVNGNKVVDENGNDISVDEIELKSAAQDDMSDDVDDSTDTVDDSAGEDKSVGKVARVVRKELAAAMKGHAVAPGVKQEVQAPAIKMQRFISCKSFSGSDAEKYEKAYDFGKLMIGAALDRGWIMGKKVPGMMDGAGTIQFLQDGTLPIGLSNDIIRFIHDMSAVRRIARVIPMSTLQHVQIVQSSYSNASFFRFATSGQINPGFTDSPFGVQAGTPTSLFSTVTLNAHEMGGIILMTKAYSDDMIAAAGATIADEIANSLATRETYAGLLGSGASDEWNGAITGLIPSLPAGSIANGPTGSATSWTVNSANYDAWLNALATMMAKIEWVDGADEPKWLCSKPFYYNVLNVVMRLMGGTQAPQMADGLPERFMGYEVVTTNMMPRSPVANSIPIVFGKFNHAMLFGDRQTIEVDWSKEATVPNGSSGQLSMWSTNTIGIRAIQRIDVKMIPRGLGTATTCGVVCGLKSAT